MDNHFNSFDNLETSIRKSSVIQERINLVSTHMYKQFLEYQRSTMNAAETFVKITDNMQATVEYLKQSFAARGVATDNIYFESDETKTVLENVENSNYTELQLRKTLANFLFFDMDVFKKVSVLSPGEKARVALCKLLLKRANMLILDEPTNHLDPETQMIIGDNFRDYKGTIILVSHNPEFVEQIGITRMLVLPSGKIEDYSHELLEYYYEINTKE